MIIGLIIAALFAGNVALLKKTNSLCLDNPEHKECRTLEKIKGEKYEVKK